MPFTVCEAYDCTLTTRDKKGRGLTFFPIPDAEDDPGLRELAAQWLICTEYTVETFDFKANKAICESHFSPDSFSYDFYRLLRDIKGLGPRYKKILKPGALPSPTEVYEHIQPERPEPDSTTVPNTRPKRLKAPSRRKREAVEEPLSPRPEEAKKQKPILETSGARKRRLMKEQKKKYPVKKAYFVRRSGDLSEIVFFAQSTPDAKMKIIKNTGSQSLAEMLEPHMVVPRHEICPVSVTNTPTEGTAESRSGTETQSVTEPQTTPQTTPAPQSLIGSKAITETQPVTMVTENQLETMVTKNQPVTLVIQNQPVTKVTDNQPVTLVTQNQPVTMVTDNQPVTVVTDNQPVTMVTQNQSVTMVTENQSVTMVTENQPETMVTEDQPETMVTENQPETMVTENQSVTLVIQNQPVTMGTQNQPVTMVTDNQPVTVVTDSQPVTMVTQNQPVTMVRNNQHVTMVTKNLPIVGSQPVTLVTESQSIVGTSPTSQPYPVSGQVGNHGNQLSTETETQSVAEKHLTLFELLTRNPPGPTAELAAGSGSQSRLQGVSDTQSGTATGSQSRLQGVQETTGSQSKVGAKGGEDGALVLDCGDTECPTQAAPSVIHSDTASPESLFDINKVKEEMDAFEADTDVVEITDGPSLLLYCEELKSEEPNSEEPKSEEPNSEEPKSEEPKSEEPKSEEGETEIKAESDITQVNVSEPTTMGSLQPGSSILGGNGNQNVPVKVPSSFIVNATRVNINSSGNQLTKLGPHLALRAGHKQLQPVTGPSFVAVPGPSIMAGTVPTQTGSRPSVMSGTVPRQNTPGSSLVAWNVPMKNLPGPLIVTGTAPRQNITGPSIVAGAVTRHNVTGPSITGTGPRQNGPGSSLVTWTKTVPMKNLPGPLIVCGTDPRRNVPGPSSVTVTVPRRNVPGPSIVTGTATGQNVPGPSIVTRTAPRQNIPGPSITGAVTRQNVPGPSVVPGTSPIRNVHGPSITGAVPRPNLPGPSSVIMTVPRPGVSCTVLGRPISILDPKGKAPAGRGVYLRTLIRLPAGVEPGANIKLISSPAQKKQ